MDFERHCDEIVTQTELLTTGLGTPDLRTPVPSCAGWSLGNLIRHIGGGHRWAAEIVRTRATGFLADDQVRRVDGDDRAELPAAWLLEGARELAGTLRAAGPAAVVWDPVGTGTTSFWARRFAHETLVHRADATLAAGPPFVAGEEVALDAVEEWLALDALPVHFDLRPDKRQLLGPDRTLALVATDADAAWSIDLTGDVITWRREPEPHGPAAVVVRGPLTDLLLVIYQRRSPDAPGITVAGDRALLDLWTAHTAFG